MLKRTADVESVTLLYTADPDASSEPSAYQTSSDEFNIAWIRGGHPILNVGDLSVEGLYSSELDDSLESSWAWVLNLKDEIYSMAYHGVGLVAAVGDGVKNLKVGTPATIMTFGSYTKFAMLRFVKSREIPSLITFNNNSISQFSFITDRSNFIISYNNHLNMTTLAEHMKVAGAENRPLMLDKTMYNSWQSRMLLYIKGKKNGRMMLESIENVLLVYPTIEENGLPPDMYSLVNHCQAAKDICDRVNLLMKGTKLSYQERECKLYNEFDKFTSQVQVNTKFLNALQPEWSKFVTDVKLAKNLNTTNYDQLYAYLSQHEGHANEARLLRERYLDPLALVANHQTQSHSAHTSSSTTIPTSIPDPTQSYTITRLVVPSFLLGDDPIACLTKAMAFMSTVMASRFPSTNNQLKTSSNPRKQTTIQDGRVTVQQVQGRQGQSFVGTRNKGNATSFKGNNAAGQARVVKCYNCQGEGHMARQCTQPKRPRNSAWFKEKMLLVQAHESGQELDKEQLEFLADLGILDGQAIQTTIP
ncbi:retrovirus-related pol polyprotein from transposon TNT 1-94 [Tanacetum coccineum]|uniref:Retrovirus-related pol polyprotein from transposon TNT 1-94 n=1 Tax=Tanacetum coccineum TaxID=301880 RepID=A0ABQ4YRP5_9ASTR